jgi:hypothetical protein
MSSTLDINCERMKSIKAIFVVVVVVVAVVVESIIHL